MSEPRAAAANAAAAAAPEPRAALRPMRPAAGPRLSGLQRPPGRELWAPPPPATRPGPPSPQNPDWISPGPATSRSGASARPRPAPSRSPPPPPVEDFPRDRGPGPRAPLQLGLWVQVRSEGRALPPQVHLNGLSVRGPIQSFRDIGEGVSIRDWGSAPKTGFPKRFHGVAAHRPGSARTAGPDSCSASEGPASPAAFCPAVRGPGTVRAFAERSGMARSKLRDFVIFKKLV